MDDGHSTRTGQSPGEWYHQRHPVRGAGQPIAGQWQQQQ